METLSIAWVNDGAPFVVSKDRLTPDDGRRILVAKLHAKRDLLKGTADMHADAVADIRREAELLAGIEGANLLVHAFLSRVDHRVAALKPSDVQANLTAEEYVAILTGLSPRGADGGSPLAKNPRPA